MTMEQLCKTTEIMPNDCPDCDCFKTTECNGFYPASKGFMKKKGNSLSGLTRKDIRGIWLFCERNAPLDIRWGQVDIENTLEDEEQHWKERSTHTIRVNVNCEDLQEVCKKELKKRKIPFDRISCYKFV